MILKDDLGKRFGNLLKCPITFLIFAVSTPDVLKMLIPHQL